MSETTERSYYLVESMYFEKLLRTHFMLTQSTLLFEHLLSHSDRPMFLSARKVCEVLGMDSVSYTHLTLPTICSV